MLIRPNITPSETDFPSEFPSILRRLKNSLKGSTFSKQAIIVNEIEEDKTRDKFM